MDHYLKRKEIIKMNTIKEILPKGWYWIGDPCYILKEELGFDWQDILEKTLYLGLYRDNEHMNTHHNYVPRESAKKVFQYKDITFGVSSTSYGDGCYYDQFGFGYSVDSGCIGAIPSNPIKMTLTEFMYLSQLMKLIYFDEEITISYNNGIIQIGSLQIDTDPSLRDHGEDLF